MTDRRSSYTRKQVMKILGVTDRTLLRWKGKKLHPWPDPDDPSGRRLLYDRAEVDNLARRRQRRGSGSYMLEREALEAASLAARPVSRPPTEKTSRGCSPEVDEARRRWEQELDERRSQGSSDFEDEQPSSKRRRA